MQQLGALELGSVRQRRLEQLADDAEGELPLQLGPARTEDPHPTVRAQRARRRKQRGLTDPGRPLDHHEPATACARLGQRRFDPRQLAASLQQRFGLAVQPHRHILYQ